MPALQIAYESFHHPLLKGKDTSQFMSTLIRFLSFFEVWFRLWFRFILLPYIFNVVLIFGLINFLNRSATCYFNMIGRQIFGNSLGFFHEYRGKVSDAQQSTSMFSPPTSFANVVTKSWIISDYCYDRFVLHAPLCIYDLIWGYPVEKYQYRSRGIFSKSYNDESEIAKKENKGNIGHIENIDYAASLKSFKLTSSASSPAKATSAAVNPPITPTDLLTENSENVPKAYSLASKKNHFKHLFTPSPLAESNLETKDSDEDILYKVTEKDLQQGSPKESATEPAPHKGSTIRIKFNRRKTSSGSIMRLTKSRKRRQSDTESFDNNSVKSSDEFNYDAVRSEIREKMKAPEGFDDGSFGPLFVRLAWHTSATYDQESRTGGSNGGTMRFVPELTDASNTGLHTALLEMEVIKQKFPWISYGDLWTLGGVTALEEMGCTPIRWKPGRVDCIDDSKVPPNGRLPLGYAGREHIREVFQKRLGLDDRETVLLIGGGHSLGRCHTKYSGWEGKWTENPIHFSNRFFTALLNENWTPYEVSSTGKKQFVNEEKGLMMLNTDMELVRDPIFKKWSEYYAEDNDRFLEEYAEVFAKLIELGVPRD